MTEREKMLAGQLYDPGDKELTALRVKAHNLCRQLNALGEEDPGREPLFRALLGKLGEEAYIVGPAQFDYGCFTEIGDYTFINFNFTCLDCAPVRIGANGFFGPDVSLLTPLHPLRYQERNLRRRADGSLYNLEYARPITIGDNCWLGGSVTVCGGVTIGAGTVVGAGSVVTRDLPENVLAVGNPCRVLRPITEADRLEPGDI